MFNLKLASITPAVGMVGLKDSEHHLLCSLVVALAGWFFFSRRTVTQGYMFSELACHKICFLAGLGPIRTLAIVRMFVSPPLLPGTGACFCTW